MLQEAEMDITTLAHSTRRTQGDQYLAVRFFLKSKQNAAKSEAAGRPIYEDVEYIEIMQPGNKDSIIVRPATSIDKGRFPEHYSKWKARTSSDNEQQLVGTPLAEWAGVTRAQADELSFFNVKTVEQLANMADSNTTNMMGLGNLKEKARKYLESSADQATVDALAALKAENAELRDMMKQFMRDQNGINQVQMRGAAQEGGQILPTMSREGYEGVSSQNVNDPRAEAQSQQSVNGGHILPQGQNTQAAMQGLPIGEYGNAPSGLQQTAGSGVAVPSVPPEGSPDPLDLVAPRGTTIAKPKRKRRSKAEMEEAKAQESAE